MKFGLLCIPDYHPDRYQSESHYYGEMLEQIQCEEELGFDGVKGDCIMFGTPDRVIQRLKRAQKDYRLDYPIFEVNFGGLPHKEAIKSLEKFAKYVMPAFK